MHEVRIARRRGIDLLALEPELRTPDAIVELQIERLGAAVVTPSATRCLRAPHRAMQMRLPLMRRLLHHE